MRLLSCQLRPRGQLPSGACASSPALTLPLCSCGRLPYVPLSKERRIEGCRLLEKVADHLPGVRDIRPLEDDDFVLLRRY